MAVRRLRRQVMRESTRPPSPFLLKPAATVIRLATWGDTAVDHGGEAVATADTVRVHAAAVPRFESGGGDEYTCRWGHRFKHGR